MVNRGLLLLLLAVMAGCSAAPDHQPESNYPHYTYALAPSSPQNFQLQAKRITPSDTFIYRPEPIPWEVLKMEVGEVTGNDRPEALLLLIKSTLYDSISRKRLFIFEAGKTEIKAVWKGSRFPFTLEDFRLVPGEGRMHIRTLERSGNDVYLVSEYEMGSFGPDYLRSLGKQLDLSAATKLFNS